MSSTLATLLCMAGIVGIFVLDRPIRERTSVGLWVSFVWLFFVLSKGPSLWLHSGPVLADAETHNLEANPLNAAVYCIIMGFGLIVLAARRKRLAEPLRANWRILLFFAYCGLSTAWSDFPGPAFRKWIRSLGDPIMVLIILTENVPAAALSRLYARLGFVLLPLSVLFIKYYPHLGRSFSNSGEPMYRGVTDHKNTLGGVCLVLGLGFFWRFLRHYKNEASARRTRHLLADCVMLGFTMWLLWRADSVTSSVCFVTGVTAALACRAWIVQHRTWALHLVVVLLLGLPVFVAYFKTDVVSHVGRDPTLTGRTDTWQQVLALAGNPLVGTGFESFWLGSRLRTMWDDNIGIRLNQAHNGYLEVYLNLGWIGVLLLAVVIVQGYSKIMQEVRSHSTFGRLKLAYFLAMLNYNHSEAGFKSQYSVWVFFLLAVLSARSRPSRPSRHVRAEATLPECARPRAEAV